ncbi:MAG: hypothetical protein JWL65_6310 [Gammaproteobacteria bacterium]|nr:hypothetical protein [Gammaproteobacteria bacterium]
MPPGAVRVSAAGRLHGYRCSSAMHLCTLIEGLILSRLEGKQARLVFGDDRRLWPTPGQHRTFTA